VTPPARFRFLGGKGGVGKTTTAAATALAAAERGGRVLLVSSDPAHSLGDALERRLSARPARVPTRRGALAAVELDADRALERWIAARRRPLRTIAARGTYLDEDDVDRLLALSLPGVDELIGLIELHRLASAAPRDHVVVDTAPTGHTLRLLAMPDSLARIAGVLADMLAKHRFLGQSLAGGHRRDAADALVAEIEGEARTLHTLLRDPARCRFTWVLLPEPMALEEARDGVAALEAAGITVDEIVVNRVTRPAGGCAACAARVAAESQVIVRLPDLFPGRRLSRVLELPREPRGLAALRGVKPGPVAMPPRSVRGSRGRAAIRISRGGGPAVRGEPVAWLDALAPRGVRVLAFAGKGGVGKTSAAAAVALALAERRPDARVLALSTDPAHSLGDALGVRLGDDERPVPGAPANLFARELDAEAAFAARRERYRASVDEIFDALLRGSRFDVAYDRDVVRELIDLAPPGLDELFGALSLVDAVFGRGRAAYDVVVLDTAPTGHALRLLAMPDAALEWVHALLAILLKYRTVVGLGELASDLLEVARDLRELTALLRDPTRTRVVAVTRPAALPRLETARLVRGLRRLGIAVGALLVNALTPDDAARRCARCRRAAATERREVDALTAAVRSGGGRRYAMIAAPVEAPPPGGVPGLARWVRRWEWRK
jgi:arsenite-transporting ATPase